MTKSKKKGRKPTRLVHSLGLKYRGITSKTRQRYEKQISIFFTYLERYKIDTPSSFRDLDEQLASYIDNMFMNGEPIGYAGDLISGISRFTPAARLRIPITRLWFRNWQREVVRVRALPIPAHVCKGMAGMALALKRIDLAALLPLSFLCMLRTGDIISLRPQDVTFSPYGSSAIIALHQTKTSGPNTEEAVLHDPRAVASLRLACKNGPRDEPIYERPPRFLGEDLKWLGKLVGFEHKRFTPYSLRRGGATWHFHKFGSLARTTMAGRWKHERTAKIYIDGAAAEWMTWQFSSAGQAMLKRGARAYRTHFDSI